MRAYRNLVLSCLAALALATTAAHAAPQAKPAAGAMSASVPGWLVGAWKLVRCDNVYPDGRRVELYGHDP
ncbi:MAG TPA: hypothetical protein VGU03_04470 [Frateuria sp.]|uniref:hypothetical protein n=1 Tax=Frateuria sp. TaxID=2211372 RepID=UPI002DE89D49|nr:hypothetical protein [Frateuria sp.]